LKTSKSNTVIEGLKLQISQKQEDVDGAKVTELNEKLATEVKSVNNTKNKIDNLFRHGGNKASLHFLPEIKRRDNDNFGPFHAHFDHIVFIEKSDQAQLSHYESGKYASLSNEFIPSLVERLGAYFSRIGTPDYSHPE
jgi:hypothetical protein